MATVVLKAGKEKPIRNRHPWVFSGAVARVQGEPMDGDVVDVVGAKGEFLARGYINRRSQIVVRCLTWSQDEAIDLSFWRRRLQQAIALRQDLLQTGMTDSCRLVHAESDLLPGLVVDTYAGFVVIQVLTFGVERCKSDIVQALVQLLQPRGIYERSDVDVREKEGLRLQAGLLWGQEPPRTVQIHEEGHRFWVDIQHGQKTGFYLDQRDNRYCLARYAHGRTVLNAFAYTGSFAVSAYSGGAERVVNVDTSTEALALARQNVALNDMPDRAEEYVSGDVFSTLRHYRAEGDKFDLIILDPPKFAHAQAQVPAACRGYKDINWVAMQLLRPGGILFTMSCSGLVTSELFQKVVFGASVDAQRNAQVLQRLSQATDHPILLSFPEGEYLKGFVCRVL